MEFQNFGTKRELRYRTLPLSTIPLWVFLCAEPNLSQAIEPIRTGKERWTQDQS